MAETTTETRALASVEFDPDGSVGGYAASYGAGIANTGWDWCCIGYGRSDYAAGDGAVETLCQVSNLGQLDLEQLETGLMRLDRSERVVEDLERDLVAEYCGERFGKPWCDCSDLEQQQAADEAWSDGACEVAVVLYVRYVEV